MADYKKSFSWRGRRESVRLPDSRSDACVTSRLRWLTFYGLQARVRMAAIKAAAAEDGTEREPDPWDMIQELLPLLHSVCSWVSPAESCRWMEEQTGVYLHESNLRMALAHPDDAWALLWRDLRRAVWMLTRVFRVSATDLLWQEHLFASLRDREPHLALGNAEQSRAALAEIARARAVLSDRWFNLEPRTRDSARRYIGLITAQDADAF